jgi:hypothetical protein
MRVKSRRTELENAEMCIKELDATNPKANIAEHRVVDKKRKAAKKAYRLWVKLRASQKYISTVDGRLRDLPDANKVRHSSRWSKQTDMQEYYDDMEQNFC